MRIVALVALLVIVGIGVVLVRRRALRAAASAAGKGAAYASLRAQILAASAARLGIALAPGQRVWGVLMELGYPGSVVTVVALRDGNASIYFSSGGGVLGGFAHEPVRQAAARLNAVAEQAGAPLARTEEHPLPAQGEARFHVLTTEGVFTAAAPEAEVQRNDHPLSALYAAGQDVITQLRLVKQKREAEAGGKA
jgi:hypothetical protein